MKIPHYSNLTRTTSRQEQEKWYNAPTSHQEGLLQLIIELQGGTFFSNLKKKKSETTKGHLKSLVAAESQFRDVTTETVEEHLIADLK